MGINVNKVFLCFCLTSLFGDMIESQDIHHTQFKQGGKKQPCPNTFVGFEKCVCDYSYGDNVEHINCTNTGLKDISILRNLKHEEVSESLQMLTLRGNNFTELPKNFLADCSKSSGKTYKNSYMDLKVLDLTDNNIQIIHGKSFHCIQNLEDLYLDGNNLESWVFEKNSRMFSDYENLKKLSLRDVFKWKSDNKIKGDVSLSKVFGDSDLEYLEELHLENNFFGNINPDVFKKLPSLKKLYLSHNLIQKPMLSSKCIDDGQEVDCALTEIYLNNNSISVLSKEFLHSLDEMWAIITAVDFSENPFMCDCRVQPFFNWMNKTDAHKILNLRHYKCAAPASVADKYIVDLKYEEIQECMAESLLYATESDPTYGARVVLGLLITAIIIAVLGLAFWKRDFIKSKTKNISLPWMPRLFSRASGYSTVENVSSKV